MPNFRKLLYPFSVLYDAVTGTRNALYDHGMFPSQSYDFPVICVGNLNTGGTGKSPMIEYLLGLLNDNYRTATLSRGYKRETKGFKMVNEQDPANLTGDEPLQFKSKFPKSIVAVDANRREGIAELLKESPEVILLDDAFQHRKVAAGFNILLTAYDDLYVEDLLLPAGNLRESGTGAGRANLIIVTKCPQSLSDLEMDQIEKKLKPLPHQKVYFTSILYADKIVSKGATLNLEDIDSENFTLVTGIANPKPLLDYLQGNSIDMNHLKFPDHHNFTASEINKLRKASKILTTEKDFMRLKDRIPLDRLFYLPIQVQFLRGKQDFDQTVLNFVHKK